MSELARFADRRIARIAEKSESTWASSSSILPPFLPAFVILSFSFRNALSDRAHRANYSPHGSVCTAWRERLMRESMHYAGTYVLFIPFTWFDKKIIFKVERGRVIPRRKRKSRLEPRPFWKVARRSRNPSTSNIVEQVIRLWSLSKRNF